MVMEVSNCFHGRPLQPSPRFDRKRRFSASSSFGVNSLHGFRSSVGPAGKQWRFCKSKSFHEFKRPENRLRRVRSASIGDDNSFSHSDEDYLQRLQELALQCHMSEENEEEEKLRSCSADLDRKRFAECISSNEGKSGYGNSGFGGPRIGSSLKSRPLFPSVKLDSNFCWPEPGWNAENLNVSRISPVTLEKKADGVGLPLSLRMLKRKQCKERGLKPGKEGFGDGLIEVGENACCSVKKAFSSMVFMMRELQNYTLQMKQIFYGDLRELVSAVQREMQDSFVWLFQHVFSCTPSLMVSVMILLTNYTVYSMNNSVALAMVEPPAFIVSILEDVGVKEALAKFVAEDPANKVSDTSFPNSRFGVLSEQRVLGDGSGGSGGRNSAIAGGTSDGDSHFDGTSQNQAMFSEDKLLNRAVSSIANPASGDIPNSIIEESAKEVQQWEAFLKKAYEELQYGEEEGLDRQTMQRFVSPISVQIEPDNYVCYDRTSLYYQHAIGMDPDNPLLLSNYAQFLHLVFHDHDRAEEYFQRAVNLDPSDAEVITRYAHFLWLARGDIEAAEEAFLDAIAADPGNPFHAGSYAHFLWNTGGEDTCYPIA